VTNITLDEWTNKYQPEMRHGTIHILDYINDSSIDFHNVWSVSYDEYSKANYIETGFHRANVIGYIITEIKWKKEYESTAIFSDEQE
jgi:hypothetical protein